MNVGLSGEMLVGGDFRWENGVPVFKDKYETRHYDIGKVFEGIFNEGRRTQSFEDSSTIEDANCRAFRLNKKLKKKDKVINELKNNRKVVCKEAYEQGRKEQLEFDLEHIEKLSKENEELKERQDELLRQLENTQRIVDKTLPARTDEPPLFHKQEERDAEILSEDCGEDVNSPASDLVNPIELSQKKRIKWVCDSLENDSSIQVPKWFKKDLTKCLKDLCKNYQEGLPQFLDFLEPFYHLPENIDLNRYFTLPLKGSESHVLGAIREVLAERKKYSSFPILLSAMRKNDKLKKAVNCHLEKLYPSIESCMKDKLNDLAAQKAQKIVREFRKGENPEEVISSLKTLSGSSQTVKISRDLTIDLLRKDAALFSKLKVVANTIKTNCKNDEKEFKKLYQNFLKVGVERDLLVREFGQELAELCQCSSIPDEFLTAELIRFWDEKKVDKVCSRAFWVCLVSCSLEDRELLSAYTDIISHSSPPELILNEIPERQRVLLCINLCQGWSKYAGIQRLFGIGSQLTLLWKEVRKAASPKERKDFVESLNRGVINYSRDHIQYMNYLDSVIYELDENIKQWNLSPLFFKKIFIRISLLPLDKAPYDKNRFAEKAVYFWNFTSYLSENFVKRLLENDSENFVNEFIRCLEESHFAKEIPIIRKQNFCDRNKAKLTIKFREAIRNSKVDFIHSFWSEIVREFYQELEKKQVLENYSIDDENLFFSQMVSYIRVLIFKKYREHEREFNPNHYNEIEKSSNYFISGFEDKFQSDVEIKKNLRDFFTLACKPEHIIDSYLMEAKEAISLTLPENFWDSSKDEMLGILKSMDLQIDYGLDKVLLFNEVKNRLALKLIQNTPKITKKVLLEIEKTENIIPSSLEKFYKDQAKLKKLKFKFLENLCRAVIISKDTSAWEHFCLRLTDPTLQLFFEKNCFTVNEWKQMVNLCKKSKMVKWSRMISNHMKTLRP